MDLDIDRLEKAETKLSYLEKAVGDLDGLVLDYGRRTERLEAMVRAMARRLAELGTGDQPGMPGDERPPHY